GRTSEKQKTYNPRERLVKSGRPRSTASFGLNQQQYTARTSQHNDKSIVPYSIDNKQVVVKTPSEELHNECSIHTKHSDLITDDWISEAQNILDNIKSTRRLSHSTCTPCLNTQYNSDINKTHLLPVIDNPDMMRCLICYRTFKFDTAIKHVEICLRKSQTNKDNGMNSLGSTVATGYSPVTIRAKQYIENLQKRRTNSFTTSGVCVEPKNENQKRKSETELLKLKKS
uniref:Uncharacterized protein n=1 Tax=Trichobilharzia regenti TaxID=157069 RepID=A0AA85J266_TRIRE